MRNFLGVLLPSRWLIFNHQQHVQPPQSPAAHCLHLTVFWQDSDDLHAPLPIPNSQASDGSGKPGKYLQVILMKTYVHSSIVVFLRRLQAHVLVATSSLLPVPPSGGTSQPLAPRVAPESHVAPTLVPSKRALTVHITGPHPSITSCTSSLCT